MASDPSQLLMYLTQNAGLNGIQADDVAARQRLQQQQIAGNALQLQQAQQQAQAQQQQAQAFQAWQQDYLRNPTPDKLAKAAILFPDQVAAFQKSWDMQNDQQKQSNLNTYGQIWEAANNNRPQLVTQQLTALQRAQQTAGQDTSSIDDALRLLQSSNPDDVKQGLNATKGITQAILAQDPDAAKTLGIGSGDGGAQWGSAGDGLIYNNRTGDYKQIGPGKTITVKNADGSESVIQVGGGDQASGTAGAPSGSSSGTSVPLSVRLNNPGAIRANPANNWQGQVGQQNGFVQFDTPENGQRAHRILISNQIKAGYDTPLAWAQHYAPASDGNNPQAYAQTIASGLGIGVNDKIPLSAVPKMAQLSAEVESGGSPPANAIAVKAAGTPTPPGVKVLYTSKPADAGQDAATVEFYAQKIAAGGDLPQLGMGKEAAALRQAILARAAQIQTGQGITGADSNLLHADVKTATTALAGLQRTRNSLDPFLKTFDGASEQVRALAPQAVGGSIPIFNRWIQAGRTSVAGDPAVSKFNVAINAVANENAKIMSGASGGAVSSDSARHEAMSLINNAQTLPQLNAVLDQMRTDTQIRMKSLDDRQAQLRATIAGKGRGNSAAPSQAQAPVRVSSPAQAAALPSGTLFITPDGRTIRKR